MLLVTLNIDISVGTAVKEKGNKLTHDLMCLYSESPDASRAASSLGYIRIDYHAFNNKHRDQSLDKYLRPCRVHDLYAISSTKINKQELYSNHR